MGVAIRRATEDDRADLVRLLDVAFMDDPVSCWVFPGLAHRRRTHAALMAAFVDISLSEGYVDITEDGAAAALWLSIPAAPAGPGDGDGGDDGADDGPAQLRAAVDPDNERVEEIGRLTSAAHPRERPHEYLWMIAVEPERQGEGLGTALITPVLDRCDHEGVAAYLEASSARSRVLYERLGFTRTGDGSGISLPDGPTMWPMWRDPQGSRP